MNSYNLQNFRDGLRDGIPIALGYLAVSFTLGIAARNFGIHAFPATIMSLTNFTSAGEFAALSIISVGAPYLELALSQAIINLRYLLCLRSCQKTPLCFTASGQVSSSQMRSLAFLLRVPES